MSSYVLNAYYCLVFSRFSVQHHDPLHGPLLGGPSRNGGWALKRHSLLQSLDGCVSDEGWDVAEASGGTDRDDTS